ncbi:MAG: GDP-mannose 4,6-dehydratase [Patescibacteria group bacterium]
MGEKRALITGITGQDGSYLAELLLSKGYKVFGLERRSSQKQRGNIAGILNQIDLLSGDLLDQASLVRALVHAGPDEVYNLAAQSFVRESYDTPVSTGEATGLGALRVLEAIRQVNPKIRFYQASSSEMFGKIRQSPQDERSAFYPRSPYGCAKVYAHYLTVNYRESYRIFAVSGILFNHESPRRGEEFVTKKIALAAARIANGLQSTLTLGDLSAKRDWGFAGEYVEAMWLMLQQTKPRDFVIATGESHSVQEFLERAFARVGLDWRQFVKFDAAHTRPAEVYNLCGNAKLAKQVLGWEPTIRFAELADLMVDYEVEQTSNQPATAIGRT